jgi:hypothetical protein
MIPLRGNDDVLMEVSKNKEDATYLAHERGKLGIEKMIDIRMLAVTKHLPHIIVRELPERDGLRVRCGG